MKKLITLIALIAIFTSCKKEELPNPYWFNMQVIEGTVSIRYDQEDQLFQQMIHEGFKPVFNPDHYPQAIDVICVEECVYTVNGETYERDHQFKNW